MQPIQDVRTSSRTLDTIERFRGRIRGRLLTPSDAGYDEARIVFYRAFDRRPAAIIQVADAGDVARVVRLAADTGLELAVRSGGHSVAGHGVSDGGLVLDLSAMLALEIDAARRTAWAQTGLTAGAYTTAAGAHGLVTGFGDSPSVGIGGLTLGGGIGYLVRRYGLTIDDLLAAEIVTADGWFLRTDAETHPDLFWAIRGGGGNFGVATRFQFRLHELDTIVGGMLMLPAEAGLVRAFIERAEAAPEELSGMASVMPAPPAPFVPREHHGRPVLMAILLYAGGVEAGERALSPFRALGAPVVDMIRPMRYPEIYQLSEGPRPAAAAIRSMFVDAVDQGAEEAILEHVRISTAPMRAVQIRVLGGAMARVPADATAFAHRGRRIMVTAAAIYERPGDAPEHEAWADSIAAAIRRGEAGAYVNFLGSEGEARVREAYPGKTWERLAAVKRRYDPGNLFRLNQNIPPTPAGRPAG